MGAMSKHFLTLGDISASLSATATAFSALADVAASMPSGGPYKWDPKHIEILDQAIDTATRVKHVFTTENIK